MPLKTQPSTTEMQVTSIRFERSLIEKLKTLAGNQGYQALIREVLWDYVHKHDENKQTERATLRIKREDIRTIMAAEAQKEEHCALTGDVIEPYEEMWMAFTERDQLVPISVDSLEK